jgi:DNA mismatch endonuclease (patch repair protein)
MLMGRVAQKGSAPEMVVRRALHRAGLRFRLHRRDLPGTPDLVLPRWRAVVFVHGCFWHRHPGCPAASMPATRAFFWAEKFAANVARDRRVQAALKAAGWNVHVVWECETRSGSWKAPLLAALDRPSRPLPHGSNRTTR